MVKSKDFLKAFRCCIPFSNDTGSADEHEQDNIDTPGETLQGVPQSDSGLDEDTKKILESSQRELSISGWYFPKMSCTEAEDCLSKCTTGTFCLRDGHSSSPRYPFTLSANYKSKVLHIRLELKSTGFCLKTRAADANRTDIPLHESPIGLTELYTPFTLDKPKVRPCWSFNGKLKGHIYLKTPYYKEVPSLQHLSRLIINRGNKTYDFPPGLKGYMVQYTNKI